MKIKYGNYLGDGYYNYPEEPIDELDLCCFMHDIDHGIIGGNSIYADRELNKRLKEIATKNLSWKGYMWYLLARYVYSSFYPDFVRLFIMKEGPEEKGVWNRSLRNRIIAYKKANRWVGFSEKIEKLILLQRNGVTS